MGQVRTGKGQGSADIQQYALDAAFAGFDDLGCRLVWPGDFPAALQGGRHGRGTPEQTTVIFFSFRVQHTDISNHFLISI